MVKEADQLPASTSSDTTGHFLFFFPFLFKSCCFEVMSDIFRKYTDILIWEFAARCRLVLCGDFDSADLINASHWEKASDIQCCECVLATYYLIKMGNKQTIFTDEQLDAYQVRFHVCVYTCATLEDLALLIFLFLYVKDEFSWQIQLCLRCIVIDAIKSVCISRDFLWLSYMSVWSFMGRWPCQTDVYQVCGAWPHQTRW